VVPASRAMAIEINNKRRGFLRFCARVTTGKTELLLRRYLPSFQQKKRYRPSRPIVPQALENKGKLQDGKLAANRP
jgi:hypothetical protein